METYQALKEAISKFAEPVSPDFTMLPLGGITRIATALALLKYVERGRLGLEDDVNEHMVRAQIM